MTRVLLVHPELGRRLDGIGDYSAHVTAELRRQGVDVAFVHVPRAEIRSELLGRLGAREDAVVFVQYNPFAWGRGGIAPRLLVDLLVLRLRRSRVRVVLGVHEASVPIRDARSLLLGTWQRFQLRLLLALVDSAVGTTEHLVARLGRLRPRRRIAYVPVGSNLPDESGGRDEARDETGLAGRLVLATMSTGHDSQLGALVVEAAAAIAARAELTVVLLLGGGNPIDPDIRGVERTVSPGFVDARTLARAVASADVFLLPFVDGASTRRGSLMAALQHGIPVVTTLTDRTDAVLSESAALAFAPADDPRAFVALACETALDAQRRVALGRAGRHLFERRFSWPVICHDLRHVLLPPDGR